MTRIDPPKARYKHTFTVYGNTHDEIEHELRIHANGGYLIDSDYHERDEWIVYKGCGTSCMEHINPSQTSERYEEELKAWSADR